MPWEYSQSSGQLRQNGRLVATGYSGSQAAGGRNNPEREAVPFVGPIPRGRYNIGAPRNHPRRGPHAMDVTPAGHNALGRTEFMMHGESRTNAPGNASQGCLIFPPNVRNQVSNSRDTVLNVIR